MAEPFTTHDVVHSARDGGSGAACTYEAGIGCGEEPYEYPER